MDPHKLDQFKPLPPLIFGTWGNPNRLEVLSVDDDPFRRDEICNWGFGSVARHPIWLTIIEQMLLNIKEEMMHIEQTSSTECKHGKEDVLRPTGP